MNKIQINYDEEADVLYLSFGNPQKAISKDVGGGVFLRFNPFTDSIIGITILDFKLRSF